jgi:hypothetical protein
MTEGWRSNSLVVGGNIEEIMREGDMETKLTVKDNI